MFLFQLPGFAVSPALWRLSARPLSGRRRSTRRQGSVGAVELIPKRRLELVSAVRQGGDEGRPAMVFDPDGEAAVSFRAIASKLSSLGPARVYRKELTLS